MTYPDIFVGSVAIGVGLLALLASLRNWELFFRSWKAEWIERLGGRTAVRTAYALFGIVLITLGIAIAWGFAPNKSSAFWRLQPTSATIER